jgi:hypothetical protein
MTACYAPLRLMKAGRRKSALRESRRVGRGPGSQPGLIPARGKAER